MNPIPFVRLLALAALVGFAAPSLEAQTYRGRIALKGEMQDLAKPGSLSFTFQGTLKDRKGYRTRVSGGGLFRTTETDLSNATFTGRLTTYTRVSARSGVRGRLIRRAKNVNIHVKDQVVLIPGTRISLNRPVDGYLDKEQPIRGKGRYRVKL